MKSSPFDQQPSDERVERACREAGLEIRSASLRDGLLQLTPKNLADLPDAGRLRRLADELTIGDVRWVTLVLQDDDD